jgi:hypothetical protein
VSEKEQKKGLALSSMDVVKGDLRVYSTQTAIGLPPVKFASPPVFLIAKSC